MLFQHKLITPLNSLRDRGERETEPVLPPAPVTSKVRGSVVAALETMTNNFLSFPLDFLRSSKTSEHNWRDDEEEDGSEERGTETNGECTALALGL